MPWGEQRLALPRGVLDQKPPYSLLAVLGLAFAGKVAFLCANPPQ
jgi:hypothetical protein